MVVLVFGWRDCNLRLQSNDLKKQQPWPVEEETISDLLYIYANCSRVLSLSPEYLIMLAMQAANLEQQERLFKSQIRLGLREILQQEMAL
jgi:hypothetical protein